MERVRLTGPCVAATADDDTVWCAAGGRLLVFDAANRLRHDADAPAGLLSLGAAGGQVAATLEPGVIAWLDPRTGDVVGRRPVGGAPTLVSGGAIWAVDTVSGRAWRLADPGVIIGPQSVSDVDRAAADGERLWWTARGDAMLRCDDRVIDVGAMSHERGDIVVCAGSVWVSVAWALVRAGAWAGARGLDVRSPVAGPARLACARGVLVGCAVGGVFVLDPRVDADARLVDADAGADAALLVATRSTAWVCPRERPEARLVAVRGR